MPRASANSIPPSRAGDVPNGAVLCMSATTGVPSPWFSAIQSSAMRNWSL